MKNKSELHSDMIVDIMILVELSPDTNSGYYN